VTGERGAAAVDYREVAGSDGGVEESEGYVAGVRDADLLRRTGCANLLLSESKRGGCKGVGGGSVTCAGERGSLRGNNGVGGVGDGELAGAGAAGGGFESDGERATGRRPKRRTAGVGRDSEIAGDDRGLERRRRSAGVGDGDVLDGGGLVDDGRGEGERAGSQSNVGCWSSSAGECDSSLASGDVGVDGEKSSASAGCRGSKDHVDGASGIDGDGLAGTVVCFSEIACDSGCSEGDRSIAGAGDRDGFCHRLRGNLLRCEGEERCRERYRGLGE